MPRGIQGFHHQQVVILGNDRRHDEQTTDAGQRPQPIGLSGDALEVLDALLGAVAAHSRATLAGEPPPTFVAQDSASVADFFLDALATGRIAYERPDGPPVPVRRAPEAEVTVESPFLW